MDGRISKRLILKTIVELELPYQAEPLDATPFKQVCQPFINLDDDQIHQLHVFRVLDVLITYYHTHLYHPGLQELREAFIPTMVDAAIRLRIAGLFSSTNMEYLYQSLILTSPEIILNALSALNFLGLLNQRMLSAIFLQPSAIPELIEAVTLFNQSTIDAIRHITIPNMRSRQLLLLAKIFQFLESRNILTEDMIPLFLTSSANLRIIKSTLRALDNLQLLNKENVLLVLIHAENILRIRLGLIDIDRHQLKSKINFSVLCRYLHQTPGIFTTFNRLNQTNILSPAMQLIAHQLTDLLPSLNAFLYTLYHVDPTQNLLNEANLMALFKFAPHAKNVLAALRAIDRGGNLTQTVFDAIVAHPKQALFIAYEVGGVPYIDDVGALNSFIEIRKAARVLSQSMRSQHSVLFTLPSELLVHICSHLTDPNELDEASAHALAHACLCTPD